LAAQRSYYNPHSVIEYAKLRLWIVGIDTLLLGYRDGIFKLLRSPGTDSQPGMPVRQPYLSYWPARLHRLADRFLGSMNVYKYGLRHHILQYIYNSLELCGTNTLSNTSVCWIVQFQHKYLGQRGNACRKFAEEGPSSPPTFTCDL
jgi:hypothetical protein